MENNAKRGYAARWSSAFAVLLASCTALAVWMPKKTNWIRRTYSDATEYLIVDVGVELLHKFGADNPVCDLRNMSATLPSGLK